MREYPGQIRRFHSPQCWTAWVLESKIRECAECTFEFLPTKRNPDATTCWACRSKDFVPGGKSYSSVKTYRKKQLIDRENGICQDCGEPGTEAHHVVPQALGGSHDLDNLKLLCADCHRGSGWERNHASLIDAGLVVFAA